MKTINLQSMKRELRMARNLAAVATFAFGMAACTQNEEQQLEATPAPHSPVNILAGVQTILSRADGVTGTAFNDGSKITVTDINNSTVTSLYTLSGDLWSATPTLYWDDLTATDGHYNIAGIWPAGSALTFTADPLKPTAEILIALSGNLQPKTAVNLDFKHVLSKLTVIVEPGTGFTADELDQSVIKLEDVKTTATFEYTDNNGFAKMAPLGAAVADFTSGALAKTAVQYTAIIPSQSLSSIKFSLANGGATYTYSTAVNLAQGKETTLTLTLNKTGIDNGNINVADWTTGKESGSIGM